VVNDVGVIVDLFCGAGGFSCGFLDSGVKLIGVDNWGVALETYKDNIGGEVIERDILKFDPSTIGKVDVLIGSPPCQTHSNANKFKTHDPALIKRYMEIRDALRPKWWVMEEVTGAVATGIIPLQYQRYLKACEFGLPHERDRLFAGNYPNVIKKGITRVVFPTPTAGYGENSGLGMLGGTAHFEMWKKILATPPKGDPIAVRQVESIKAFRRERNVPMSSTAGIRASITIEFCTWLMGFPADYRFHGTRSEQFKQIGNAVCPPVARAICEAIKSGREPPMVQKTLW